MTYRLLTTLTLALLIGPGSAVQAQDPDEPTPPRVRAPRVVIPRFNPGLDHYHWEFRAPRIRVRPRIRVPEYGLRDFAYQDGHRLWMHDELSDEARERLHERLEAARERMDEARERMQESRERALERSQELRERMLERQEELRERAMERSRDLRDRQLERQEELRHRLDERMRDLHDRMLSRRERYRGI